MISRGILAMKSFTEFLTESTKQYNFRIKVAGTLSDEQVDRLESAMEKWGLQSINKPKVTPIQKHPVDFTNLKEIEVSIMDMTLDYPATPQEIIARIAEYCTLNPEYVKVFNSDDPNVAEMEERAEEAEEEYEVQLTAPYPKSDKNLPYGDKFNQKFLKDQKRKPAFKVAGGNTSKVQSTNDLPQGKSSPISGRKGK
jgi:hypothetical protein